MSEWGRVHKKILFVMTDKFDLVGVVLVMYKERRENANALWNDFNQKDVEAKTK